MRDRANFFRRSTRAALICPSGRLLDVVDFWLQEVTPGVHLQLETIQDADAILAGFSFDRPGDVETRRYRATNVGFGLSYVLPVLTGLLADAGTLCLLENPEAHLHPRGQTRLAELAVRASLAGVQVIAETHSDHFMDGVRIAVRNGLIQPEDVAFHYFARDGGRTVVSSPQVGADGRLSEWPAGFFDQHEDNLIKAAWHRSPDMREMVLNHASVLVPGSNRCEISAWLRELAEGMRRLVEAEVVLKSLRTAHALYDTQCLRGYSLFDAYLTLQSGGFREEFRC